MYTHQTPLPAACVLFVLSTVFAVAQRIERKVAGTFVAHLTFPAAAGPDSAAAAAAADLALAHTGRRDRERET